MTDTLFRDVSYYNPALNNSYPHPVVSLRSNDGTFRDPDFQQNIAWAKHACDTGKLTCFGVYFVLENDARGSVETFKQMVGVPHPKMFIIVDVESWGGKITGDHSPQITAARNELVNWLRGHRGKLGALVDRYLGRQHKRVLVYGNVGDLNALYPHRPRGLSYVVAAYGSNPAFPGEVAHQFASDYTADGLPAGDINSADGLTPADFARAVGCIQLSAKQRLALFRRHNAKKGGKK